MNLTVLRMAGTLMIIGMMLALSGCKPQVVEVEDNSPTRDERVHDAWELCTGFSKFESEYEPEIVPQDVRIACTQAIYGGK